MNIDWAQMLSQLKEIQGFRFYFIVFLIFALVLAFMFKDEISVQVKDMNFKQVEFREVRDLKGLEVNLESILDTTVMTSYTVYIYQPKDRSYYKRVVITNSDLVKSLSKLQSGYLQDQEHINKALIDNQYVFLDKDYPSPESQHLHDLGVPYILVYKLGGVNDKVGEISITFKSKPSDEYLKKLKAKLAPLTYMYIY